LTMCYKNFVISVSLHQGCPARGHRFHAPWSVTLIIILKGCTVRKTYSGEIFAPVSLCPSQIPRQLAWDQTQDSAKTGWRLTEWSSGWTRASLL